jgi:hypothetical protein
MDGTAKQGPRPVRRKLDRVEARLLRLYANKDALVHELLVRTAT